MKHCKFICILATILFCSFNSFGRPAYDTSTIDGLYSYIFALLDKTQIPTQYLEEYGAPITPLAPYNGVLSTANNITMTLWRTLYWQINTAYVGTSTNNFAAPRTMNTTVKANLTNGGPTPIVVLFANYNNVKSNAFSSNLLTVVNNQVKDVPGRSASPYQAQTLFAACPEENNTRTGDATFIFKTALQFTNSSVSVSSFYIDFADGNGYRAVGWNTPVTANYLDTGTKQIKIKMKLSNGSSYECYSNYYVARPSSAASRYSNSYDFSQSFPVRSGVHSGGTAFVEYSTLNKSSHKITKPFIVIEGYDIANAAPDLRKDRTSYSDLIKDFTNAELQGYDFNKHLDEDGNYDLIFIQFNNGTDDIKRNASLIREIIKWVNDQKAAAGGGQQNVILGESMGGLIARYALADMTKNYPATPTQTRLLVTHDSPHRGANFALGLQYIIQMAGHVHLFGNDIRDVFASYDEAIGLLNETGSQQMILYRSTGETTCVANTFLDGEYRNMITFSGTGPQPSYQFIATSMGSECGVPLYPPYQKILNVDVDAFLFLVPLLSYRFHTQVEDYALPVNGSTSKIAKLLLKSKFKLFGLITVSKDVYNNTAYAPGYQIPVDGASGSKYDFSNFDAPGAGSVPSFNIFLPVSPFFGIIGYIYAYSSGGTPTNSTFVPTGSALDVSPYNSSTLSQKFVAGSNPNYPSTSLNYIAQEPFVLNGTTLYNNYHWTYTARNSQWLFDRMQGISDNLNCSSACQPDYAITGASYFCGNTSPYSIKGVASGATVTWSTSPSGYAYPSPPTGSSTTLNKQSKGNITLTATISACNQVVTLPVSVGAPTVSASGTPYGACTYRTQTWSLTASPALGSNWNWQADYVPVGSSITIRNGSSYSAYADVIGGGTVKLSYTDVCGVISNIGGPTVYSNCSGKHLYNIAPNPANNLITINASNKNIDIKSPNDLIFAIKIADRYGIVRKLSSYKSGVILATLSVADLKAGTYLVGIFDGKEWSSQKLIVQK